MKTIETYNNTVLEGLKLTEITQAHNKLAAEINVKPVKKFRDKPTAIARYVEVRKEYKSALRASEKPATENKDDKIHGLVKTSKVQTVKDSGKEGTIENTIHAGILEGNNTVDSLVGYIVKNHKRPRSGTGVDAQYAAHNIKWFVNKGHISLEK